MKEVGRLAKVKTKRVENRSAKEVGKKGGGSKDKSWISNLTGQT